MSRPIVECIDQHAKRLFVRCLKSQDRDGLLELVDSGMVRAHQPMARDLTAACFTLGYTNHQLRTRHGTAWAFWPLWETEEFGKEHLDRYLYVAARGYSNIMNTDGADGHLRIVRHLVLCGASPDRMYQDGSYMFSARGWAGGNLQSHLPGLIEAIEEAEAVREANFRKGLAASFGRRELPEGNLPYHYSRQVG